MTTIITSTTRLLAVLGDPVSHSLSPHFQNAAIQAAGLDGVYLAIRCTATDFPGLMRGIANAGGGGNVTIPHKGLAANTVDRGTEAVVRTGACNTFWLEDGLVCGDNTDVDGFSRALRALLGESPAGARVLLLGAGGVASAALYSLLMERAGEVVIANRSIGRAEELCARMTSPHTSVRAVPPTELSGEHFDVAINATSLGLRDSDPLPLSPEAGVSIGAALDLVYAPGRTPWIRQQIARGTPAADGLEMLLYQGAAAFERWWQVPAPIDAMRAALPPR